MTSYKGLSQGFLDSMLLSASATGDFEKTKDLILSDANVNSVGSRTDKYTSLHQAAQYGRERITELLLLSGADPNIVSEYGQTPMMHACYYGQLGVIKLLVSWGADVKLRDESGRTAEAIALHYGYRNVVEYLRSVAEMQI